MAFGRKASVTTMSSKPCRFSSSTMCSIIGRLASGIIGLGWLLVRGRRRLPSPPAMMTAFIGSRPYPAALSARPSASARFAIGT